MLLTIGRERGWDRRKFMQVLLAFGLGGPTLLTACGGTDDDQDTGPGLLESLAELIRNRPVRRNANTMTADDPVIVSYANAVQAMQALPETDPRNWNRWADIHRLYCPHSNWLFLPWHRIYLYQFERICRQLSGDPAFALPYWNWTENATIPAALHDGVLDDSTRAAGETGPVGGAAVAANAIESILAEQNFVLFASGSIRADQAQTDRSTSGPLESVPHNTVHSDIGGGDWPPSGNMGTTRFAARDPVFWLHHNMIEYLWIHWNVTLGRRNTDHEAWVGRTFDEFFDEHGAPLTGLSASVAWSILYPLLAYRFEPSQVGVP